VHRCKFISHASLHAFDSFVDCVIGVAYACYTYLLMLPLGFIDESSCVLFHQSFSSVLYAVRIVE
jgi:hypothetical protein